MAVTCTQPLTDKIVEMVRLGVPPMIASEAHGVQQSDFVEWMRKGQVNGRGHRNFAQFYEAILKAEAECESALVGRILVAAATDWKAAAWLAERRFPERYVRKPVSEAGDAKKPGAPGQADPFDSVDKVVPLKVAK